MVRKTTQVWRAFVIFVEFCDFSCAPKPLFLRRKSRLRGGRIETRFVSARVMVHRNSIFAGASEPLTFVSSNSHSATRVRIAAANNCKAMCELLCALVIAIVAGEGIVNSIALR